MKVERIESEKLKAVGLRNKVATLEEVRFTHEWLRAGTVFLRVAVIHNLGKQFIDRAWIECFLFRNAEEGRRTKSAC